MIDQESREARKRKGGQVEGMTMTRKSRRYIYIYIVEVEARGDRNDGAQQTH